MLFGQHPVGIGITYITLLVRAAFICSDTELFALLPSFFPSAGLL